MCAQVGKWGGVFISRPIGIVSCIDICDGDFSPLHRDCDDTKMPLAPPASFATPPTVLEINPKSFPETRLSGPFCASAAARRFPEADRLLSRALQSGSGRLRKLSDLLIHRCLSIIYAALGRPCWSPAFFRPLRFLPKGLSPPLGLVCSSKLRIR